MCAALAPVADRGTGAGAVVVPARAEALPSAGERWLGVFEIEAVTNSGPSEQAWRARRSDTGASVELRWAEAGDPLREEAWTRLRGIELPQLSRVGERVAVGAGFVEVNETRGETLRAWRARRPKVDLALLEKFVAQMAEAIGALHAHGLVHLGLRPEAVTVEEDAGEVCFVVGGLGRVAVSDRKERLALEVDPFYAPPEAAGLVEHPPGATLCAWDWWTLGRLAQEMWLGRHVFERAAEGQPEAARAKLEEILLEKDGQKGVRAGGVELMAPLDARVDLLLRGLLTSAVESRWGSEFVDRWTRKMPVKEVYSAPKVDAWFRWRGRPWAPEEAARVLRTAAEWSGAAEQIWEAGKRGTLAHFLKSAQTEALKKTQARLADLLALATAPALKPWPAEVVKEALTAVALLQLGGAPFLWRGEKLGGDASDERITLLRVLTARPMLLEIERCDSDTARSLAELAKLVAEAEALVRRAGAIVAADGDVTGAFFKLALQSANEVAAASEELRRTFPLSTQAVPQKLIANEKPTRVELMALAWMARAPKRYGFITAAEAQQCDAEKWRERGAAVARGLFWTRLERALAGGPLVFGGMGVVAGAWALVVLGVVMVVPGIGGVLLALLVGAAVVGLRVSAASVIGASVKRFSPAAQDWSWRDGAARCRAELGTLPESGDAAALAEANAELAKLTLVEPRPSPVAEPATFAGVRVLGLAGWVIFAAALGTLGWRAKAQLPSWEQHRVAWGLPEPGARDPNEPVLVSWPYKAGDNAETMTVVRTFEAAKEQQKEMLALGRTKAAPYRPETISTLVVLNVPGAEANAVMIFDGKRGTLANQKIYVLSYRPLARAWIEIGDFKGIYLPD